MRTKSVVAISCGSILFLGVPPSWGETRDQAKTRFLAACAVSAQLDNPLGSETSRNAFCKCRVEALSVTHSPAQIDQIAAYIEEANGTLLSHPVPLVGVDLAANQSTAEACQAGVTKQ